MGNRRNEQAKTWFRSERFFRSDDKWYFHTREGMAVGPYVSRLEAELDAGMLLAVLMNTPFEEAPTAIRDFITRSESGVNLVHAPAVGAA